MIDTKDSFKDYKNYEDWANQYINLLTNKRYGKAWTLNESEFMPYIVKQGYATDPNYISKYNKVLNEVKKYEVGGKIKRFQGSGVITRDNTRMIVKPAPRLKEKPKLPIQNQTYLSQAPSKEIIENNNLMQKRRELGNTITEFGTNLLDALKIGMSFANPAAGMALGLGDAGINTVQGNYTEGAVQAGLEMVPYGVGKVPVVKKAVKQGVKKYGTKVANGADKVIPRSFDWFHTWNAKDNIKHASFDDVVNAKKSRMAHNPPEYTWDDVESLVKEWDPKGELSELYGKDALYDEAYKVLPDPVVRQQKLSSTPRDATNMEILGFLEKEKKSREMLGRIGYKNALDRYSDDILKSFAGSDHIHVGTKRYNEFLMPWDKDFYKGTPDSPFNVGTTYAHEFDHYMGNPSLKEAKKIDEVFTLEGVPSNRITYFTRENRSDLKARMGQFKDLFLLKDNNPISPSQARVAAKMYSNPDKYKLIPNMLDLKTNFSKIDYDKLAELINSLSLKNGGKLYGLR